MRGTYVTATVIAVLIAVWLFSGQFGAAEKGAEPALAQANRERTAHAEDTDPVRVRARVINAVPRTRHVVLRGRTENKRTVEVKAETSGRVVGRPVERGSQVGHGDLLCRISTEDREAALAEARAALDQAGIEYQASLRLKEKGFQSETAIAQAKARLAAAQAQVERGELDLDRTYVRAPFAGIVEDVLLEIGDYVTPGGTCVTVVDMNPMLLVGRVSEREVAKIEIGATVTGNLADGRRVQGPVTFVGQQADPDTRTYPVEVEIDNPDYALRSGITTQIAIPVAEVMAHKISPALFALDDDGNVGVRVINAERRVEFHHIEVIDDDADGVWVTGLPKVTTLITVGQELVVAGQEVDPAFEPSAEMPARARGEETESPASTQVGGAGRGAGADRTTASVAIAARP